MNTIRGGSEGLREAGEEARRFGFILDNETIKKADAANDELMRMGLAARTSGTRLAAEMLPAITRLREIMTSREFQNAITVLAQAFNGMFDTRTIDTIVEAEGGIGEIRKKLIDLTQASVENRAEAERLGQTWQYKVFGIGSAVRFKLNNDAFMAEREVARLQGIIDRFGQRQPLPTEFRTEVHPIDRHNEEQVKKALEDLEFRARVANQEFSALAQGAPEVAHGLGAIGQAALKAYIDGKPLPDVLKAINDRQNKLNAANMHQELLEPIEKYRQEVERLNVLYSSGSLSLEDYTRKLFQLRETLAQTDGRAISLQNAAQGIGQAFGSALDSAVVDFNNLHDVAITLLKDIQRAIFQSFVSKPITNSITNLLGGAGGLFNSFLGNSAGTWAQGTTVTKSDKGNVFRYGRVVPHALGDILSKSVAFPMAGNNVGTAAESHSEAIMPIARGPDGKLGVMSTGDSGKTEINYNFSPGMSPADMAFIRSQIEAASRATEQRVISMIRDRHQTDSNFLFA
jgi:hypothetical protein